MGEKECLNGADDNKIGEKGQENEGGGEEEGKEMIEKNREMNCDWLSIVIGHIWKERGEGEEEEGGGMGQQTSHNMRKPIILHCLSFFCDARRQPE